MGIRHDEVMVVNGRLAQVGLSFRTGKRADRNAVFNCVCGEVIVVSVRSVKSGNTSSCGCYNIDKIKQRMSILNGTHRKSNTPEYRAWAGMMARVRGTGKLKDRKHYFDRGISVCDRWIRFENFLDDMGHKPSPEHSLDRIDSNRGYEKSNCRWATCTTQNRNRRSNLNLTFNGKTQCMSAWAIEAGLNIQTLYYRLRNGWSPERAITEPVKKVG